MRERNTRTDRPPSSPSRGWHPTCSCFGTLQGAIRAPVLGGSRQMIFTETELQGVYVIEPLRREDDRGFFARVWCQRELQERGLNSCVAQVNAGFTRRKGGLRGLHYQLPPRQEVKIARCTMGALFDVVLDLRPGSPTYRQWIGVELTATNHRMVYVPQGCAHGYQALVDDTEMYYQTSDFYAPELARGVRYDDPAFDIRWPLPVTSMSVADRSWPAYRGDPLLSEHSMTRG
jgi:dTDP-4-dehydrorhamnose 3,5-epimerase